MSEEAQKSEASTREAPGSGPVGAAPGAGRGAGDAGSLAEDALPIFGIALVTFVLFKVLSLFVAPANVILCLLAIGHPAGVLVGALRYEGRFEAALQRFFVVACGSVLALAALRWVTPALVPPWISGGYPLGSVTRLLAVCGAAFMPLFVGSGVVEYMVLQRCRARTGSAGRAYGVLLGGTLAGLVVGFLLLRAAGAAGLLALAMGVLAAATMKGRRAVGTALGTGALACAACAVFPGIDAAFIAGVAPGGRFTARGALDEGATLVTASWDRQSYTQVLATGDRTLGAYDNLVYWDVARHVERKKDSKDDLVFRVLPRESHVAIIGVGGGRQLHQALASDMGLAVDGFEINETIVQHYKASPGDNGGAFVAPGVRLFAQDGRRGVLEHGPYDCVYLPEAGTVLGYYRTLAIDLNFLHTADAYRGYSSQLREGGLLASAFASWADPHNYVTRRVAASFRGMGLAVRAFATPEWAVVLGTRPGAGEAMLLRAEEIAREQGIPALREDDPSGAALPGDDAGLNLILALTSRGQIRGAFLGSAALVGLACAAAWIALVRTARRRAAEARAGTPLLLAMGLGASFLVVENAVILNLARRLWNMADAVILGSAAFLVCAVIGAATAHALAGRRGATAARLSLLGLGASLIVVSPPESGLVLAGALVLGVSSGSFFPLLLDARGPGLTPYVYAADGLGALFGTLVVFFVPLLFGIGVLSVVAAATCAVVGGGVVLSARRAA